MLPLTFVITRAAAVIAAHALRWLARFATRLVARRLDVPDFVVHGICLYVAAYVAEVERNASRAPSSGARLRRSPRAG